MARSPKPTEEAASRAGLDVEAVRARVESVLADELYWFPVRHHSLAVARHLEQAILARRPRVVFIEGPHEATSLIPHVVDAKTRPPVAIYSSYRDDDNVLGLAGIASPADDVPARFASWYPLLAYSPEYVAMLAARKVGAEVVFIDLPHHALIRAAGAGQPPPPAVEQEDEKLLFESGFYQRLAEVAGYRSWPEAWDSLFEVREFAGVEEFRREMATFCAAARATTPGERVRTDGTLERERFMWQTIRATLRDDKIAPKEALVVCGGFHLFLDRHDKALPPPTPAGTVYVTVVPYSFFRVSELSGYAAGNRAPQFYQTWWELEQEGRGKDVVVEHVVAVLKAGRRGGEPLSSADAIAVCQHALMLARLRGRPAPVLDDVHDALITCCCKGAPEDQGAHLLQAIDAAGIGTKIGKVTPALGQLPIVNDFHAQMSDLDLGEVLERERRMVLPLDKREPLGARRSVFLHRLRFLTVPIGEMDAPPSGDFSTGTIFKEKWALRWGPAVEPALIEQNLYGDTVESASLGRLREELARDAGHAGKTCRRLVEAVDMDLPDLVARAEDACGRAIDTDSRFVSLCDALGHLAVIERYAATRNLRRERIEDLIERCFDRACFALPGVSSVPEDQQAEVVEALRALAEAVLRSRAGLDRALFAESVRQAAQGSPVPFLRGAFLGMLTELRDLTPEDLAAEVAALARAPVELMITAGDFLDGILAVSRTSILLGADALIAALDELLRAAEWEPFLTMLPRLRAAFERLHESQRGSLAGSVASLYGLAQGEELMELGASVGAAARIARIDEQVARIMSEWGLE